MIWKQNDPTDRNHTCVISPSATRLPERWTSVPQAKTSPPKKKLFFRQLFPKLKPPSSKYLPKRQRRYHPKTWPPKPEDPPQKISPSKHNRRRSSLQLPAAKKNTLSLNIPPRVDLSLVLKKASSDSLTAIPEATRGFLRALHLVRKKKPAEKW